MYAFLSIQQHKKYKELALERRQKIFNMFICFRPYIFMFTCGTNTANMWYALTDT
jgi:hypothetical protein